MAKKEENQRRKAKDQAKYLADRKMAKEKMKERDLAKYKADQKMARERIKEKDLIRYKAGQQEAMKRKLEEDPDYYNRAIEKFRKRQKENIDERQRRLNFNHAIIFGPIFICSCCERKLYEKTVTKITDKFKEMIEKKKPNFFNFVIRQEINVHIQLDGKSNKSGAYICITCRSAMLMARVPSMATVNGLFLPPYTEELRLTELENNLIAQIINFQYIYQLKKSRWAATKKQMITVPVTSKTIQNTVD